ncbi:Cullin-6 [Caenorhabditis elegans]|uniref:Cullin-6 n=1 Tax=Caenorhabditis elegans TaxID=6239 RepID=CUL6_CAEEL|nr:Cullin-6 [Caenorhabditis elegans]Q21346.1 RecName: Full=Cullin-6 [Caenorhabditis elegans]CAB01230.1 Cullin-6 [Caenorhabditis elegans]|eukprot:NP_502412.1 Cullin-6 [Caenorhabditis elegans]
MSIEAVWGTLQDGLNLLYRREHMSKKYYMMLYDAVYNICTTTTLANSNNNSPEFASEFLYKQLENYIRTYVIAIRDRISACSGDELLGKCTIEWDNFKFSTRICNCIFQYLNRNFVSKKVEDKNGEIVEIYKLALDIWKAEFFDNFKVKTIDAILELILLERCGSTINSTHISSVVECLTELDIYKVSFEPQFLDATKLFYKQEVLNSKETVIEYMITVENRLFQEEYRSRRYLGPSTNDLLIDSCESILISDRLKFLHSEFERLLEARKDEHLTRMYSLCRRVTHGLEDLRVYLEKRILKEGHETLQRLAKDSGLKTTPKEYITKLLEVHEIYFNLINKAFDRNALFMQSLDKASKDFIEANAVTMLAPEKHRSTRSADYLARYCDQLLKKNSKVQDETALDKALTVLKYISEKDVFQLYYQNWFSERIINNSSASDDAEEKFITNLTATEGLEYTRNLVKMVEDAKISKDLTTEFKDIKTEKSIDFNVILQTTGAWPSLDQIKIILPRELSTILKEFDTFYNASHNGRRLNWAYSQCRGEVNSKAFEKKYVFIVTASQLCTLYLFNEQDSFTIEQISKAIEMTAKSTSAIVGSLNPVIDPVLVVDKGNEKDGYPPDAVVSLNTKYANKKVRVDLTTAIKKATADRETDAVQNTVESDRKYEIKACIVRIMKTRKSLTHTLLINEIISQLKSRFTPNVQMIKICIEILIEQLYIRRSENEHNVYEYLA